MPSCSRIRSWTRLGLGVAKLAADQHSITTRGGLKIGSILLNIALSSSPSPWLISQNLPLILDFAQILTKTLQYVNEKCVIKRAKCQGRASYDFAANKKISRNFSLISKPCLSHVQVTHVTCQQTRMRPLY
jgi:hypothetical protein